MCVWGEGRGREGGAYMSWNISLYSSSPFKLKRRSSILSNTSVSTYKEGRQGLSEGRREREREREREKLTLLKFPLACCSQLIISTTTGRAMVRSCLDLSRVISRYGPIKPGMKFAFFSPRRCHITTTCLPSFTRWSPNLMSVCVCVCVCVCVYMYMCVCVCVYKCVSILCMVHDSSSP